jgi:hypothetical protein
MGFVLATDPLADIHHLLAAAITVGRSILQNSLDAEAERHLSFSLSG